MAGNSALGTAGTPSAEVLSIQGVDGGNALPIAPETSDDTTPGTVNASATSVLLLATNANRRQALFFNDSTDILYIKLESTAATTSFTVKLVAGAYFELPQPVYTGNIYGIWSGTNGSCKVTEI